MTNANPLPHYRSQIDQIDSRILELLADRIEVVKKVGEYKKTENLPALDQSRWQAVLDKLELKCQEFNLDFELVKDLWNRIHTYAVEWESDNNQLIQNFQKVCAVLVRENRLLVVKSDKHDEYLPVGGKIEISESPEEALVREVQAEIGISIDSSKLFLETPAEPALGKPGSTVKAFCFLIKSDQEVSINNEIRELFWISKQDFENKKVKISSILEKFILPELIRLGLLE